MSGTVRKVSDTASHHCILTSNDATESIRHRRQDLCGLWAVSLTKRIVPTERMCIARSGRSSQSFSSLYERTHFDYRWYKALTGDFTLCTYNGT